MNEQELREKVARFLYVDDANSRGLLVKDWGNLAPYAKDSFIKRAQQILDLIKEAGWVKLSKDQRRPGNPNKYPASSLWLVYDGTQKDMLKAGWRKVERV